MNARVCGPTTSLPSVRGCWCAGLSFLVAAGAQSRSLVIHLRQTRYSAGLEPDLKTLIYRILIALAGIVGVAMQIWQDGFGMLTYYTVLSNILVTFFVLYLIARQICQGWVPESRRLMRTKGGVTMAILITFAIYHFLLSPLVEPQEYWNIRNFLVHYIVPLSFFVDTLFLDRRRQYRLFDPLLWALIPLSYSVLAIFNGLVAKIEVPGSPDSPFPYFFVNVTKYGLSGVLQNSAGIFVTYVVIGYLFFVVKRFIGISDRRATAQP